MKAESQVVVGLDIGYGNTKIRWGITNDGKHFTEGQLAFRSAAPAIRDRRDLNELAGTSSRQVVPIEINGKIYAVGPDAHLTHSPVLVAADERYIHRPEYMALVRGALHYMMMHCGQIIRAIDVIAVGLPVSGYRNDATLLATRMKGTHPVPIPAKLQALAYLESHVAVGVKKVIVLPQPVGALVTWAAEAGNTAALSSDTTNLVIDPGFNTFDWLVADGMRPIYERSGDFPGGVSEITRQVANEAKKSLRVELGPKDVEAGLDKGYVSPKGQRTDFASYRVMAKSIAANLIETFLSKYDRMAMVDNVILTGGGAKYFAEPLREHFGHITVPRDPVMANATGFYLCAADALSQQR